MGLELNDLQLESRTRRKLFWEIYNQERSSDPKDMIKTQKRRERLWQEEAIDALDPDKIKRETQAKIHFLEKTIEEKKMAAIPIVAHYANNNGKVSEEMDKIVSKELLELNVLKSKIKNPEGVDLSNNEILKKAIEDLRKPITSDDAKLLETQDKLVKERWKKWERRSVRIGAATGTLIGAAVGTALFPGMGTLGGAAIGGAIGGVVGVFPGASIINSFINNKIIPYRKAKKQTKLIAKIAKKEEKRLNPNRQPKHWRKTRERYNKVKEWYYNRLHPTTVLGWRKPIGTFFSNVSQGIASGTSLITGGISTEIYNSVGDYFNPRIPDVLVQNDDNPNPDIMDSINVAWQNPTQPTPVTNNDNELTEERNLNPVREEVNLQPTTEGVVELRETVTREVEVPKQDKKENTQLLEFTKGPDRKGQTNRNIFPRNPFRKSKKGKTPKPGGFSNNHI